MPKLAVYNSKGKEVGSVAVDDAFIAEKVNKGVLYQAIKHYLAAKHRGTHKVKTRREVSGGGKKPWRQKGTGRARVGSIRSPLWRGGGVIFGPTVRSYAYTIPQKARQLALLEAIKSKIQDKNIIIFDKITLEKPKTKDIVSIIKSLKIDKKCLMVQESVDKNIRLATRNITGLSIMNRKDINALDVLRHDTLAVSEEAFANLFKESK
ncbi:MAG: 50S ribosomal protein L4 [Candidatus Omnitrophica bacterium]|nr:50S ribosomal protein L4 [Candidatus Omnitrophota bacterium]